MAQACVMARPRQEQQLLTPGRQPPLSPQLDNSLITSAARKRKVDPAESPLPPAALEEGKRQRTPSVGHGLNEAELGVGAPLAATPLATPLAPPPAVEERQQQPGPWQQAHAAQQQQQQHGALPHAALQQQHAHLHAHHLHGHGPDGRRAPSLPADDAEDVLFSPVFHLCREGSRDDLACGGASEAAAADAAAAADQAAAAGARLPLPPPAARPSSYHTEATHTSTDHSTGTSAAVTDGEGEMGGASYDAPSAELGSCELGGLGVARARAEARAAAEAAAHAEEAAEEAAEEGEEYLEFDPLLFISRLPPLDRCVPPRREFLLPKRTRRSKLKTLVLDLDETLVHSTLDGYCRPDFTFPVEVGQLRHMVSVRQRPHLHTFLERVAELYEVVVFTASQRVYAEQLLNVVDPQRRLVRHRVYRESCVFWEGNYLKDLTVLGRDLAHTIIVDNSPQAFGFQLDNGIPIESWYDDDDDQELLKLLPFLEAVAHSEDVRPHIQRRYRLRSLVEAAAVPAVAAQQQQQTVQQQVEEQAQRAQQQSV